MPRLCGQEIEKGIMCLYLCLWVDECSVHLNCFFFLPVFCFQEATIPSAEALIILDFHFSDFGLPEDLTTQATIRMFLDLNLVKDFNIDYKVTDLLIIRLHGYSRFCGREK